MPERYDQLPTHMDTDETLEALTHIYQRDSGVYPLSQVEVAHANAIGSEVFRTFMDWGDANREAESTDHNDIPCTTFEVVVAEMVGHYAALRITRLLDATLPLRTLRKVANLLGHPTTDVNGLVLGAYRETAINRTVVRLRELDSTFIPIAPLDIPVRRAAIDVTRDMMIEERFHYL